ncbi:MAG: hypothetical protein IJQ12_05800 [Lachnospiraceae bacterium]|nr:hypothetical protein [Lachnospiraceae bacterium]
MEVEFSVGLHDPFSYSLIYFLIAVVVMAGAAFLFSMFYWRYRLLRARYAQGRQVVKPPKVVLPVIRHKYRRQLFRLQSAMQTESVETRVAYQELSRIVRAFVHEATGLDVRNETLSEIELLHIPGLSALVKEYYGPEFSAYGAGNPAEACARTAQVIDTWR